MTSPQPTPQDSELEELKAILFDSNHDRPLYPEDEDLPRVLLDLIQWANKRAEKRVANVTRFEVIDAAGRSYIHDPLFHAPATFELSYQDDGRTLKVFVNAQQKEGSDE